MVDVTYQSPLERNFCCIAVIKALKQRGMAFLHCASHPICQSMGIHGWGESTHQSRYRPRAASLILERCTVAL
jgi:hypothetical protein